ncbi:hypothetical protein [Pseudoxanthomonas sp.]|jgi:hypothetical protein|uniref:hypothetical protein n=1 Tax=Pseudoxanthomonas sp. TaxID=1871049 RepID=UPI002FE1A3B3
MSPSATLTQLKATVDGRALKSGDSDSEIAVRVGSCIALQVNVQSGQLAGFAAGTDSMALSEWNDTGTFEFHVPEHFQGAVLQIQVAVRTKASTGAQTNPWLGPVDAQHLLTYQVHPGHGDATTLPCP